LGYKKALDRADDLYKQVLETREAALDSEFLSLASQLGVEQTSRLDTGLKSRDPNEFVTKMRHFMLKDASLKVEEGEEETEFLDWSKVGKISMNYFKKTPNISFMYGPLSVESTPVVRKERQRKEKENVGEKIVPEQIKDSQIDQEALDKATSKRVEDLRGHLERSKHIDFFKLVVNGQSFSQTVENIFHFSFLVKDGQAAIKVNESGNLVAEPAQPPLPEDYSSGKAERRQSVVPITLDMWNTIKEKYDIENSYLPHRKPGTYTQLNTQQPIPTREEEQQEQPRRQSSQQPRLQHSLQSRSNQKRKNSSKKKNSKKEDEESSSESMELLESTPSSQHKKRIRKRTDSSDSEEENSLEDQRKKKRNN